MSDTVRFLRSQDIDVDEYWFQHLIYNSKEEHAAQLRCLRSLGMKPWFSNGFCMVPDGMDFKKFDAAIREVKKLEPRAVFSANLRGKSLRRYYTAHHDWAPVECCTSPWRHVNALPNGELWVCFDYLLGNITSQDFASAWNGPAARKLRLLLSKKMLPGCRGCFDYYSMRPNDAG